MNTQQAPLDTGLGYKPEPDEIMSAIDLTDRRAVVTGGYSGIGLETVRALAKAGAQIIIPARRVDSAQMAIKDIDGDIKIMPMDLGDLDSVRGFTDALLKEAKPLDLLINNAGIMACPETRIGGNINQHTDQSKNAQWEAQFAVNHIGHFVLTNGLIPLLKQADHARIVCLSSIAHKRSAIRWDDIHFQKEPYEKWTAYGQAKTANSLFAVALDEKLKGEGVRAFAVHPGGIMTPLQRHLQNEEMVALGWIDEEGNIAENAREFFKTPAQGCATTLWCAVSPQLEGLGGVYCEDCNISRLMDQASAPYVDVANWAVDREAAMRLWSLTEDILARG